MNVFRARAQEPHASLILVGLKTDLAADETVARGLLARGLQVVTKPQGLALAQEIGASCFIECSSQTYDGVPRVLEEAVTASLEHLQRQRLARPIPTACCAIT